MPRPPVNATAVGQLQSRDHNADAWLLRRQWSGATLFGQRTKVIIAKARLERAGTPPAVAVKLPLTR